MRFEAMASQLERSDILFEFLAIMRSAPILPLPLRPVQPLLIRAAKPVTFFDRGLRVLTWRIPKTVMQKSLWRRAHRGGRARPAALAVFCL